MTGPAKLNEFYAAEDPARQLLEGLGCTYLPWEVLAAERGDERSVPTEHPLESVRLYSMDYAGTGQLIAAPRQWERGTR